MPALDIRVASDPAAEAAELIVARLAGAARRRGEAHLALSGGSTGPALIAAIAAACPPWDDLTVWQVDERVAPDGSDDRNAGQLDVFVGRCAVQTMPVLAARRREAARRYGAALPDRLDVVHLGLGTDGHTASWPPGDEQPIVSYRRVELVDDFNGFDRMTLTRRVINGARLRVVLAVGSSKRPCIEGWLADDRSLPITRVRRRDTVVVVDPDAGLAATAPVAYRTLSVAQ